MVGGNCLHHIGRESGMSTVTQPYEFSNLPIKVSGGDVVARISGVIERRRHGQHVHYGDLSLQAENGGLIEVVEDDSLYDVVVEALQLADSGRKQTAGETPSSLDSEDGEGAEKESG
jgi:hypothetical protein